MALLEEQRVGLAMLTFLVDAIKHIHVVVEAFKIHGVEGDLDGRVGAALGLEHGVVKPSCVDACVCVCVCCFVCHKH